MDKTSVLYFLIFPHGIEDAVNHKLVEDMKRNHVEMGVDAHILSERAPKACFNFKAEKKTTSKKDKSTADNQIMKLDSKENAEAASIRIEEHSSLDDPKKCREVHEAIKTLDGVLFFHFDTARTPRESQLRVINDTLQRNRTVEKVCLHLFSCPCKDSVEEITEPFGRHRGKIFDTVVQHLSQLRQDLETFQPSGYRPMSTISHQVLYRVNCIRRDKSVPCNFKSTDIAAHLGGLFADYDEFASWQVNMLYYNVEFYVVHDKHFAHVGVSLSPDALPRCGADLNLTSQFALECERDYIGYLLGNGKLNPAKDTNLRALVPRYSSHRNELRMKKGDNAMNPTLANALIEYSDLFSPSSATASPELEPLTVLDPFAGSGTVIVEILAKAFTSEWRRPLNVMGSDLCKEDSERMGCNFKIENILGCALFQEVVDLANEGSSLTKGNFEKLLRMQKAIRHWKSDIQKSVQQVDISSLAADNVAAALHHSLQKEVVDFQEQTLGEIATMQGKAFQMCRGSVALALRCDGTKLPWKDGSVDRIISDLPFGRRCGSHKTNTDLYPKLLKECYRVLAYSRDGDGRRLTPPTRNLLEPEIKFDSNYSCDWWKKHLDRPASYGRAVLLTIEGELMMETLESLKDECPFVLYAQPFCVNMGGLFPYVFVLDKF